jgi:hypothetical protein
LYREADGKVVHLHQVVVFEGGSDVTPEMAEKEAHDNARRRGHELSKLTTLRVGPRLPSSNGGYRVDLARKELVAVELPARRRSK